MSDKSALRLRRKADLSLWGRWACGAPAATSLLALCCLEVRSAGQTNTTTLRDEWVDADTGHRVVRLSRLPGTSESFYFHQNAFTAEGDKMVFVNSAPGAGSRLFVLDLATRKTEALTESGVRGGVVGRSSRRVYYQRQGALYATHLDTHETKLIAHLPTRWGVATINSDESLAAGTFTEPGSQSVDVSGPKSAWFDKVFEAKRTQDLFTVVLATGQTNAFYRQEAWLNHVQFSPADPGLLMFCHEGPWHKVDRIWVIRTDGSGLRLMHRRTVPMEIAGHEFWSPDGKQIWFDLQVPRGETFFLAGVEVATGKETRYALKRDEWSVHYNISPGQHLFAGDGGAPNMVAHASYGKWIRLFTPQPDGTLRSERLVNIALHNYSLEPNVNFTPDGKWIVFRGNFDGSPQVYAVEVAKAGALRTNSGDRDAPTLMRLLPPAGAETAASPAGRQLPALFLIGDSTVRNHTRGQLGWGDPIAAWFDPAKLIVFNRALGGRSSRTFLTEGLWDKVLQEIKPGDFVLMQFGHNDGGALTDGRGRASLKGVGDESQVVTNKASALTETVHTYGWYLSKYITDTKAKGATPIVLSLVPRKIWKDGKIVRGNNDYAKWAAEAAKAEGVEFVDLNDIVARHYEELGPEKVGTLFGDEHTHTNEEGARLNAQYVVEGLRALAHCALVEYLAAPSVDFHNWAETPPMGWNSWDCFATTVTESQAKAQADYMAEHLRRYGWQYVVVDIQWYEPRAKGYDYRKDAALTMDDFGRLWPATNRFPSAANGVGFKALSDNFHGKSLKFGVHLMRGIPRQAVARNTSVKGTAFHAADIAATNSTCTWNGDMYGVDAARPGAQEYYNSVFELLAEWGVDFVKVDDIARPYHKAEIEAIRRAIDRTGRPMVLSLSPGATPVAEGEHVAGHANMWRVSDDFWDKWSLLFDQFARLRNWTPHRGPGHFPDADMLPLGEVGMGRRTKFTSDEQYALMSLWCIARSPLIFGGDLTKMDEFTLSLLTNPEVLAVDQQSSSNQELYHRDGLVAWTAEVPGSPDKYVALFNTRDPQPNGAMSRVPVEFASLGLPGTCRVRDLWKQEDLGEFSSEFAAELPSHGAGLYRFAPPSGTSVPH